MNKKYLISIAMALLTLSYYTHRLWVFAGKVSKSFEYTYAAVDCLIQENGQNETDVNILFDGYKSRKAYVNAANKKYPGLYPKDSPILVRKTYNDQLPQCKIFYSQYRCWELDPYDPKSLDGCGEHFGLTKEEIETMKKDPSSIDRVMDGMFKRIKNNHE